MRKTEDFEVFRNNKVDDALNKARDNSPIGGNQRPGADKIYYGK